MQPPHSLTQIAQKARNTQAASLEELFPGSFALIRHLVWKVAVIILMADL